MNTFPFILRIAGLNIAVWPLAAHFDDFAKRYGEFATDSKAVEACDMHIRVTKEMIDAEREQADSPDYSDAYLQTLAVYRAIAEQAPKFSRFLMHAAVVEYGGRAYAFTAPSGTGKSTHIRLWRECLGDAATVINGDKPLVHMEAAALGGDGSMRAVAYGTPWCGKEGWNANACAPLAGVCLVQRGRVNACQRVSAAEALDWLCRQVYMPQGTQAGLETLGLMDALLRAVPAYRLQCDMSHDAVRASFEAMTGLDFGENGQAQPQGCDPRDVSRGAGDRERESETANATNDAECAQRDAAHGEADEGR